MGHRERVHGPELARNVGRAGDDAVDRHAVSGPDHDDVTHVQLVDRNFDERTRATREHVIPRVMGGPSWLENEVAACRRCNSERGHTAPVEWLEECARRGWHPDEARLTRVLTALCAGVADETTAAALTEMSGAGVEIA